MGGILRSLIGPILRPVLRPLTRFLVGMIAIPLFRLFLRRVVRLQDLDAELEKDLEQWFRGSLLLLVATANMEAVLFDWVPLDWKDGWIPVALRLLLAVGVIEAMPDQELFAIIHPGPPKLKFSKKQGYLRELREQCWPICRGLLCQHLNRSSPVFAIMAAVFGGERGETLWTVGWVCYGFAIVQYLIIGLVTSRDKALDVLSEFDRKVAVRRREIIEEFDIPQHGSATPTAEPAPAASSEGSPAQQETGDGIVAKESSGG